MKHKWTAITAILMAILVLATAAVPAFAETEADDGTARKPQVKALGIKAPRMAMVGNEVTITVFERGTQQPIAGASVWAISHDNTEEFRNSMTDIEAEIALGNEDHDYDALCGLYGEFLGKTSGQGEVIHTFNETGRYLLVATKNHYYPGFSRINIRTKPNALAIRAPRVAHVDNDVTMMVTDRISHDPVEGAGVWAFSRENAESLRSEIADIKAEIQQSAQEHDYESLMNIYGEFLGRTNSDGKLIHAFDETGKYVLLTWKSGYWPGFSHITIKAKRSVLAIRAPRTTLVDKEMTMTVYESPGSIATDIAPITVEGAGVWALSRENAEELKVEIEGLRTSDETNGLEMDYESMISIYGEFLGRTDENGQLKHVFGETGEYVLVTWKQGYWPGFARLTVRELPKVLGIDAPRVAPVQQEVTMSVFQRGTHEPVGGADIWAFTWDQKESLRDAMSDIRSSDAQAFDYQSIASSNGGVYLGQTGNNGELVHEFDNSGKYLLLTFKDGYWPGFGWIKITELRQVQPSAVEELILE